MSFIQNFFTSRDNNSNAATYVGQQDRLWYNPITQTLYVSDGVTPGGIPVNLATGANITANVITVNTLTSSSGNIAVAGNLVITGNISPATDVKIGGVKAGPGANIANDGTLTIDTTGLPLSFGNFTANNNILSIVNVNENMILDTQGNAEIQLVGNIGFYKSNGGGAPDPGNVFFRALEDGQLFIYVTAQDSNAGAVEIIGSSTGNTITPGTTGTMLHVTGQRGDPCRLYYDGNGNYVSWVARRWNGNVANPTPVLAGEDVLRINATAATNAGVGNVAMAQISVMALENQTTTAQGSEISFVVTPVGQPATNRVEIANVTVANGVTATRFTTSGNISAVGNISGGNLILSTGGIISSSGLISTTANVSGGNILTGGLVSATGNVTGGNISTAGLITATGNVTGGNIVTSALVSARNYNGQARDAGTLGAAGTLTIDFATDNMVLVNLTTTATIAFANITAGKTVAVLVKNSTGQNRAVTLGVAGTNTSGGNPAPNVNDGRTGVFVYRTFNTDIGNVFCEVN
jgi:hypothetical protein